MMTNEEQKLFDNAGKAAAVYSKKCGELQEELDLIRLHDELCLESDSEVASCSCLTKSPDIQYHKPGCKYRLIIERNSARKEVEDSQKRFNDILKAMQGDTSYVAGNIRRIIFK